MIADTTDKVLENWDKIKSDEKARATVYSQMESIPPMLPALMRARKIGARAAKVGFDFPDVWQAYQKIEEESLELKDSLGTEHAREEIGDLLFSVVNVARLLGIDPEQALNDSNKKFMSRFKKLEESILSEGKDMRQMSIDELDAYYDKAKNSQ